MSERHSDVEKPPIDELVEEHPRQDVGLDTRINIFTPEEQKKIIFRIDCRLVLTLGFLYMISLMDRTNLGSASIAG
jgi:hypothetical protein